MATVAPVSFFQNDPNLAASAALIQQRQAMAQALMQQGMTPLDTNNRTIGGVGYRISPMEGLAKMLQTYVGRQGVEQATSDLGALGNQAYQAQVARLQPGQSPSFSPEQVSQASQNALSQGAAQGDVGPTVTNGQRIGAALMGQQPTNAGRPTNPLNPNGVPAELLAQATMGMIPEKLAELQMARYAPNATTVQALQGGMDPMQANRDAQIKANAATPQITAMKQAGFTDQQIAQLIAATNTKDLTIAARPNQSMFTAGANGMMSLGAVAPDPEGNNQYNVNNGQVSAASVPGVVQNSAQISGAKAGASAAATAPFDVVTGYDSTTNTPFLASKSTVVGGGGQGGSIGAASSSRPFVQAGPGPLASGRIAGVQSHFKDISAQADQAENVAGNLGNIMSLAQRAQVGPLSDKLTYVNSLLSLAGSDKATDQNTAMQLLNKNANQIVAKLGAGGMATDAARTILGSAYPNAHMNTGALDEASRNLLGASEMAKAQRNFLQPAYQQGDLTGYEQRRSLFNSNANANIFQWHMMPDGPAKTAFAQKLMQQDPNTPAKIQALESAGGFQ
jgi:hypothetical protein